MKSELIPRLVGRNNELELLLDRLGRAIEGQGATIFIAGEPGIGKTRLADEFCSLASRLGVRIGIGRCISGLKSPYFPILHSLLELDKTHAIKMDRGTMSLDDAMVRIGFTELTETASPKIVCETSATFLRVLDYIKSEALHGPIIMRIEDLQWADSVSLQLLHFLSRNIKESDVLVIGTYRSDEVLESRRNYGVSLLETLRLMRREGLLYEIMLKNVDPEALMSAIEEKIGGRLASDVRKEVLRYSNGNPLFAIEIVRWLIDSQSIVQSEECWRLANRRSVTLAPSVTEVILRRIDLLSQDEIRLLKTASIIGTSFNAEVLSKVFETSTVEVRKVLEELVSRTSLIESDENRYRFSHPLIQRVVQDLLSPLNRKENHKRIGEILETEEPMPGRFSKLSEHFFLSNDWGKCASYSFSAGLECLGQFANGEAVQYFERAMEADRKAVPAKLDKQKVIEALGDAWFNLGMLEWAYDCFRTVIRHGTSPRDRARLLRKQAYCEIPGAGDNLLGESLKLLEDARACQDIDPFDLALIELSEGLIHNARGVFDLALHHCMESERLFSRLGDNHGLTQALVNRAVTELSIGDIRSADEHLMSAASISKDLRSPNLDMEVHRHCAHLFWMKGVFEKSQSEWQSVMSVAEKFDIVLQLVWAQYYICLIHDAMGDSTRALDCSRLAVDLASRIQSNQAAIRSRALMAHCLLQCGRLDEAETALSECRTLQEKNPLDIGVQRGFIAMVEAELLSAKGEYDESNAEFSIGIELLGRSLFAPMYRSMANTLFGRSLANQGRMEEAKVVLKSALMEYEKIENQVMAQTVRELMNELTEAG